MNRIERQNLAEDIAEMIGTFEHALWALNDGNNKTAKKQFEHATKTAQRLQRQLLFKLD